MILAGAVPGRRCWRCVVDGALAWARALARPRGGAARRGVCAAVAAAVLAARPRARRRRSRRGGDAIVVGSKNFTEQIILGELVAQTLERDTALRSTGGSTSAARSSATARMRAGDIDVYVEYTGTALTAIFKEPRAGDPRGG